jgi:hypothetical protein
MIVHNGTLGTITTPGSITAEIAQGRGPGAWTGTGITSSAAAANPSKFDVGYLNGAAASDAGHGVGSNQVEIQYALAGDAFLENTTVGFDDLVVVAQNFGATGKDWAAGNFNYDPTGSVGFSDLVNVAQNFGASTGVTVDVSPVTGTAPLTGKVSAPALASPVANTPITIAATTASSTSADDDVLDSLLGDGGSILG